MVLNLGSTIYYNLKKFYLLLEFTNLFIMKFSIFFSCLIGIVLLVHTNLFSQDLILKKNGDEISAKVTEITVDAVKYKRFDNIEGPIYSILKSELFMVRYQNGSKEIFGVSTSSDRVLPVGTEIKIKSISKVVTRKLNDGDEIKFETSENVILGSTVLIPKGNPVIATVKDITKGKALGKEGKLEITFNYVQLSDGSKIKITSTKSISGKNNAASAIVGAVLLTPIWLLTSGGEAKIKEGEILSVFVE